VADNTPEDAAAIIDGLAEEVAAEIGDDVLLEAGQMAVDLVVMRTAKGLDADRQPFRTYSKGYERWKKKKGHATRVNLAFTGHMLGSVGANLLPGEVFVGPSGLAESAKFAWHTYGTKRGLPIRDALDVRHTAEIDVLADIFGDDYELRIEKALKIG
jgi:hypothetical protein